MKRHPALASLSRDHHHALVLAQKLRRATEEAIPAAALAFLSHWEAEESLHFRVEEEILLPAYAEHGDLRHPAITRMLEDHVRIRRDADLLARQPSLLLLHQLGTQLAEHVQFEEHEVFPLIERTIPDDDLTKLGQRLNGPQPS